MAGKRTQLSLDEARRTALAAQGFGRPRPASRIDARHFRRVVSDVQVVQLDSVNVLARAHYLPFYSRLGPYSRDALDKWLWRSGEVFEYWGHEASLLPIELRPALAHRMAGGWKWWSGGIGRMEREHPELVAAVLERVRAEGPLGAGDFEGAARGPWWGWSDAKRALEHLFLSGALTTADRVNFARRYDLAERVHRPEVLAWPGLDEEAGQLELLARAASALGVATAHDLTDYFRLPLTATRALLPRLVDRGDLETVNVEGWREAAYLHREAAVPRKIEARALLAPFDPVVWYRDRAERLFDFRYRIEIYTPAPKRVYGYYVLPFLLDDRLVARIDLKADRASSALLVRTAHPEPGVDLPRVASELTAELASAARWLELEAVTIEAPGELGDTLRQIAPTSTAAR
jgi:uncharacterized protein